VTGYGRGYFSFPMMLLLAEKVVPLVVVILEAAGY
jgi:hypothetical protein